MYKIVTTATAILFSFLVVQIWYSPENFVSDLGLTPSVESSLILRRASIFMIGIVVMTFMVRNLTLSEARQKICLSIAITFLGLAIIGSYEFYRGTVNYSILLAVSIETLFAFAYMIIFFKNKKLI